MHALPLAFLALVLALPAEAQVYRVYVAAESDDTVSLIRFDQNGASVEKTLSVGTIPTEIEGPHGLTVSPDGRFWYLSLAHGQPYGKVVKYATGTNDRLGEVELDFFPASMHISRATGLLYVVNFNLHGNMEPSTVSVVDPVMMTEVGRTITGIMPHGSRLSPDGLRHYSAAMMTGELVEIDAVSFDVLRRLRTGDGDVKPSWVAPHPTAPFVYVANNGNDEVVEIDLDTWTIARRFSLPGAPYNLEVTPEGRLLVASLKKSGETGIVDLATGGIQARIRNSRSVTHGVAVSPDGRYAFVSVEGIGAEPGSVDVIDLNELRLVAVVETGRQAGGIAFWTMSKAD